MWTLAGSCRSVRGVIPQSGGGAPATATADSKGVEAAIAEGLKLLQAQLVAKASKEEVETAITKARDTSVDAQERLRVVMASLESLQASTAP